MESKIINWLNYILKFRISDDIYLTYDEIEKIYIINFKNDKLQIKVKSEKELYSVYMNNYNVFNDSVYLNKNIFDDLVYITTKNKVQDSTKIRIHSNVILFNYDFLGLIFWMLNRVEEYDYKNIKDFHNRFTSKDSILYEGNYFLRPIVDEWITFLRNVINFYSPNTKLITHNFKFRLTHDVDRPFRYLYTKCHIFIFRILFDFLKKKISLSNLVKLCYYKFFYKKKILQNDVYNNFEELISLSKLTHSSSTFFFMAGCTHNSTDPDYNLSNSEILELGKKIINSGNEIGLHPSYNTYNNLVELQKEVNNFKIFFSQLGLSKFICSRMHYLRFNYPETLINLENLGVDVDETMAFADTIGFRCGTSFEYHPFNLWNNEQMKIKIRPLHAMQWSINSPNYMGLNIEEGFEQLFLMYEKINKHGGQFNYLIHNDEFYELGFNFRTSLNFFIKKINCD
jgi:hypothetical protein